jgi:hypothetical protein
VWELTVLSVHNAVLRSNGRNNSEKSNSLKKHTEAYLNSVEERGINEVGKLRSPSPLLELLRGGAQTHCYATDVARNRYRVAYQSWTE